MANRITATAMIAWSAPSPSSPAPAARRIWSASRSSSSPMFPLVAVVQARHRPTSSRAAFRLKRFSPRSRWPNTPTARRCTGGKRSTRDGVDLERSTMAQWMGKVGFELQPLADYVLTKIKQGERSSPIRRPCRRSLSDRARRKMPGCGPMRGTIGRLAAMVLRWWPTASRTAAAAMRRAPSGGLCRHPAGRRLCRLQSACQAGLRQ